MIKSKNKILFVTKGKISKVIEQIKEQQSKGK